MTERFIKFIPSEESDYLQENHPNAMLLLMFIAKRARRISGKPDGLEIGEALIGDFKKSGIQSRQQYRTALDILILRSHIKKVETCRDRKKSTTGTTTIGTKVRILRSDIWDINADDINHRVNHRPTTDQPPTNHEQECKEDIRNERIIHIASNDFDESNKCTDLQHNIYSRTASPPRIVEITFSFENRKFENITEQDQEAWKQTYPAVDLKQEFLRMIEWCLGNLAKSKSKKKWRQFINNWLTKANETKLNQEAYRQGFKPIVKQSNRDKVIAKFKHGEVYNGAECYLNGESIAFQRGMTHCQLRFNDSAFSPQFENILRKFDIKVDWS